MGNVVFGGHSFSLGNEKVLEMDGGDRCTTQNLTTQNIKMVKIVLYMYFTTIFNNLKTTTTF